jgi:hypothetical protein
MAAQFNPCVAIGVRDKSASAAGFCDLLGGQVTDQRDDWVEVTAGPFRFYFVEDGTSDVAFSVDVADEAELLPKLLKRGFVVDVATTERVGETFVRSPDGVLINLCPVRPASGV